MGFFSFSNSFDIALNRPKKEVFEKFVHHVTTKGWLVQHAEPGNTLLFKTDITLFSWPISFTLNFISDTENSTILRVSAKAMHLDLGRSERIINEMINNIYW